MRDIRDSITELENLSFWIGTQVDLVQGPGGNTSFKNDQVIWVKASGKQLRDAKSQNIFVRIEQEKPLNLNDTSKLKPSIELFLHKNCPCNFVAHTHSIGAMALSFRTDAQSIIKNIFENIRISFVPYGRPGEELEIKISQKVDYSYHEAAILENHGLLVWGETALEVRSKIEKVEKVLRDWRILGFSSKDEFNSNEVRKIPGKFLTPDQAVFLPDFSDLEKPDKYEEKWLRDLNQALRSSLQLIPQDVAINFLPEREAIELQEWESEIARKLANL